MRHPFIVFFFCLSACASSPRKPAAETAPIPQVSNDDLTLQQALELGAGATLEKLKAQNKALPIEGLAAARDPAALLPPSLKAERPAPLTKDRLELRTELHRFANWTPAHKIKKAEQLSEDFQCGDALKAQALALSLELEFPDAVASQASQGLHEKVLRCHAFAGQESLFRLSVFAIQRGDCPKALEYLDQFPTGQERGVNDRIAYLHSLCSAQAETSRRNPIGGYGILLSSVDSSKQGTASWSLSTLSGDPDWDRLLASMLELHAKDQSDTIQYLAGKINYDRFRELPLAFQTSMLVLMSFAGADLPVFQTLHHYLSEHPEKMAPEVMGLLFPTRYWQQILENSKSVDPILVKALIRQESAFNPMARSRAHAAGLMQLVYPTAKNYGIKRPKELLRPDANIHAGSEFLARLIEEFGSVELALAAYNAGPAVVHQWIRRYPTKNIDLFVEMIPYTETREYVRLVRRNFKVYRSFLTHRQALTGYTLDP